MFAVHPVTLFARSQGATFPVDITKTRLQLQGQADFTGSKLVRAPALEPMHSVACMLIGP